MYSRSPPLLVEQNSWLVFILNCVPATICICFIARGLLLEFSPLKDGQSTLQRTHKALWGFSIHISWLTLLLLLLLFISSSFRVTGDTLLLVIISFTFYTTLTRPQTTATALHFANGWFKTLATTNDKLQLHLIQWRTVYCGKQKQLLLVSQSSKDWEYLTIVLTTPHPQP